ncbi:hypothetical protein, partial [Salmonella enterica]|uniref:hypothetical protein n=1 Tax=Salmonella enterica TaxID=28901 RepID=UPI0035268A22
PYGVCQHDSVFPASAVFSSLASTPTSASLKIVPIRAFNLRIIHMTIHDQSFKGKSDTILAATRSKHARTYNPKTRSRAQTVRRHFNAICTNVEAQQQ